MSKSKHTPGPWSVVPRFSLTAVVAGEHGEKIAATKAGHVFPDRPLIEAEANARLIAAAPEMLAVLKQAAHEAESLGGEIWRDTYDKMCAAIAKAEGR